MLTLLLSASAGVLPLPVGPSSLAPHLLTVEQGVRLTWMQPHGDAHQVRTSLWDGAHWSQPSIVAESPRLVANWADTPIAARAGDGSTIISYPKKSGDGTYAYDVVLTRSTDGQSWSELGSPHRDGTQTEHGFPSIIAESTGFRVFWLDGRATATGGPMSLRTTTWSNGFQASTVLDERVCDCCATAAIGGSAWRVVYRDRSENEIRDIRIAGVELNQAVNDDHWEMPGCPVNGPSIARAGSSTTVAWTTGVRGPLEVRVQSDGVRVLSPAESHPVGRVNLVPHGDEVIATWLGPEGVLATRLDHGHAGDEFAIAPASGARGTGFPRSAVLGDTLLTVWTEKSGVVGIEHKLASLSAPSRLLPPVRSTTTQELTTRPSLAGTDLQGKAWTLQSVEGPVFVALWASWCGPCRSEIPALEELVRTHPDVPLVVVAVDDDPASIRRATRSLPGTWVTAERAAVEQAFGNAAVPRIWRFDTKGQATWSATGPLETAP